MNKINKLLKSSNNHLQVNNTLFSSELRGLPLLKRLHKNRTPLILVGAIELLRNNATSNGIWLRKVNYAPVSIGRLCIHMATGCLKKTI